MYLSYVNDGKQGLTWNALVAGALIIMNKTCSPAEITLFIWTKKDPPIQLSQLVNAALAKMEEKALVTRLKRGNYGITLLGKRTFERTLDFSETYHNLKSFSDSKVFGYESGRKNRKHRRRA